MADGAYAACRRCGLWAFSNRATPTFPRRNCEEIADRLRTDRIPTDVLCLDIDFQDENWPFTVDPEALSKFPRMVNDLTAEQFHAGRHH